MKKQLRLLRKSSYITVEMILTLNFYPRLFVDLVTTSLSLCECFSKTTLLSISSIVKIRYSSLCKPLSRTNRSAQFTAANVGAIQITFINPQHKTTTCFFSSLCMCSTNSGKPTTQNWQRPDRVAVTTWAPDIG